MPRLQRTEIWSDLQAAGGTRLGVIPDVLNLADLRRVTGEDQLTLEMPIASGAYQYIREQRVIRTVFADGSAAGAFDEWRINKLGKKRGSDGNVASIVALPILYDLARALVSRTEADGSVVYDFEVLGLTPQQHWSTFLSAALTAHGMGAYFGLNTVDENVIIPSFVYSSTSVLNAVRRLAQAASSLTYPAGLEVEFLRSGTSAYNVNLLHAIGSTATTRHVLLGKDLQGVDRQTDTNAQATRIVPRGASIDGLYPTMARARWRVSAVAGSDVTLEDPAGLAAPIAFNDQLNGFYLRKTSGAFTLISASVASTQKITVASAAAVSVGDLLEIRLDSSGTDLTYLESPADKTTYGLIAAPIDRPEIPGTINLVLNPALTNWSAGVPVTWAKLGGGSCTLTDTTTATRWRNGGHSARVQTTADAAGLETDPITIAPSTAKPYFSGYCGFYLVSGRVRVEFVTNAGLVIPNGTTDGKAFTNETGVWIDLGAAGVDLNALAATSIKMRIVQDGAGTAEFYLDAGQITQTADQQALMLGSGPNQLWQEANRLLLQNSQPIAALAVTLIDVHRMNPTLFANDELVLGGTVRIKDTQLGLDTTTRFAEIQRDLLRHGLSKVALTNRVPDLIDRITAPARPERDNGPPIDRMVNQLVARITRVSETADDITLRVAFIGASAAMTGLGTLTVSIVTDAGGLSVSPASPQTLTATASFATTGYVDYTITKPAQGADPRRVAFTGTATGHLDATDGVDVNPKSYPYRTRAILSSDQTVPTDALGYVPFGAELYDVGSMHTTGGTNERITPPSGIAGTWTVKAQAVFENNAVGNRILEIWIYNGVTDVPLVSVVVPAISGQINGNNLPTIVQAITEITGPFVGGEFIYMQVAQTSGGDLLLLTDLPYGDAGSTLSQYGSYLILELKV